MSEKNIKKLPNSAVEFSFTVAREAYEKAFKRSIEKAKPQVKIPGFRPGKAPEDSVISAVGLHRLHEEAMEMAINSAVSEVVEKENLHILATPTIKVDENRPDKEFPFHFTAIVDVYPEVELGDYQSIKWPSYQNEVSEKEVEESILAFLRSKKLGKKVDRKPKKGDLVCIDFSGKNKDGKKIQNTEAEKYWLSLGEGHFIENLEKVIEKMTLGESRKSEKIRFPEQYHEKALAGTDVFFDVVLHEVKEVDSKYITKEEWEREAGVKDLVSFREETKKWLQSQKEQSNKQQARQAYEIAFAKIINTEIPKIWIEKEKKAYIERYLQQGHWANEEEFWKKSGMPKEKALKTVEMQAEQQIKVTLGLSKVIEKEKITLSDKELKTAQLIAKQQGVDTEQVAWNMRIDKYFASLVK